MLEAALSTSPVVTRLLVGAPVRPQKHVSRAPPRRRNMPAWALCITIPDDRGDESFADDLNMGRGIVSGRVALLLRSTEIRPHRPNDLLPPSNSQTPGCACFCPLSTLDQKKMCFHSRVPRRRHQPSFPTKDLATGTPSSSRRDSLLAPGLPAPRVGTPCSRRDSQLLASGLPARAGTPTSRRDSLLAPGLPAPRVGTPCSRRDSLLAPGLPAPRAGTPTSRRDSLLASGLPARAGTPCSSCRDSHLASGLPARAGTPTSRRDTSDIGISLDSLLTWSPDDVDSR